MNARLLLIGCFTSLLLVVSACKNDETPSTAGEEAVECGPSPCGACASGYVNRDRCENGKWDCTCEPAGSETSTTKTTDDEADSSDPGAPPVTDCDDILRAPGASRCVSEDELKRCTRGCLTCQCTDGRWGCKTSDTCFADAG